MAFAADEHLSRDPGMGDGIWYALHDEYDDDGCMVKRPCSYNPGTGECEGSCRGCEGYVPDPAMD